MDLPAAQVRLTFVAVSEDSRCPTRVQCVWAGNGAVRVVVESGGGSEVGAVLNTTVEPGEVAVGDYTLRLVELAPYPEEPGEIAPDAYRATFILEVSAAD